MSWTWAGAAACAVLVTLVRTRSVSGQAGDPYRTAVQPFLAKNCYVCHNDKLKTANLNLEAYRDPGLAVKEVQVWDKVRDKLATGKMPPPGQPVPAPAEVQAVTAWIDSLVGRAGPSSESDPGRVTARRLNRAEYNNTVRDLLGVHVRPADEFPVDDAGYGFDNIGDVLSVSPLLMEKYLAAARRVSRLAVYGETFSSNPTVLARLEPKKAHDETGPVLAPGDYLPYSLRGALYGNFTFPVDGEYEFRLRVANYRGRDPNDLTPEQREALRERRRRFLELQRHNAGQPQALRERRPPTPEELRAREEEACKAFPPAPVVLALDGKPILTDVVRGNSDCEYERGALTARVRVTAGEHFLRASFPELADIEDPIRNINPDGRRKLFIDYLDVVGPFQPSPEPPASHKKIFICGHSAGGHEGGCGRRIIEHLGRRAYRRPVTRQEVDGLLGLVALAQKEGDTFEEGVRLAIEAMLVSPNFLFRIEREPPAGSAHLIGEHELATRLSYFLWASMPDEELFHAAERQTLRNPGVLESQVRRMLADPKASSLAENFASQWLNLGNLRRNKPDPGRFPAVDDELLDAMRRETMLFVEAIFREDRSILDFIDAPFTFLNGPLARHYGIAGVKGEEFRRVTLDGERRGGLLTQASVLTVSSFPTRTSPVVRGKWVLENLLGASPPAPPADVPALEETGLGSAASLRERLEQHRRNPSCAVCHNQMDPIGFGLEHYDAVGVWRTHDGKFPIDASGTLPDGRSFQGATGLRQILRAQADAFARNLTEKMLTYALGRGLERHDSAAVDRITREVAANRYRASTLILEIVNSRPFQMRSGAGGGQ